MEPRTTIEAEIWLICDADATKDEERGGMKSREKTVEEVQDLHLKDVQARAFAALALSSTDIEGYDYHE